MGYNDDLKNLRKELRKDMLKAGIKASVTGQRGTGWGWTDIYPKGKEWSPKEMKTLNEDFNIHIGHPSNAGLLTMEKLSTSVGGYKQKGFKKSKKYRGFVDEFSLCASQQECRGTCCGGAGTIVRRKGVDIDFIKQFGQSDSKNIIAERLMHNRAKQLGLELKHESGWMD